MSSTRADPKPYHHGDLRNALLAEAERILEAEGVNGLTLRAVARGVGVTHAAPASHFGDLTGLLSELAADGHRRMVAAMVEAMVAAGNDPGERIRAMGRAYVTFAKANIGLFTLMSRTERLDDRRPALRDAIIASRQALREALAGLPGKQSMSPTTAAAQATALWALVHGYATLMLEGRLKGTLAALPDQHTPESFFHLVLDAMKLSQ